MTKELGTKKFLLGDEFSAADMFVAYEIGMLAFGVITDKWPVVKAYHARLAERPSFKAVFDNMGPNKKAE